MFLSCLTFVKGVTLQSLMLPDGEEMWSCAL